MKKIITLAFIILFTVSCSNNTNKSAEYREVDTKAVATKTVFVSANWLKSVIDNKQEESKKYVIVETNWGSANDSPDYNSGHIPGAIHIDINSIEDEPYWNLRPAKEIEKSLLDNGISDDTVVIIYGADVSGTARLAYAYLWAGVKNVKILNGGLDAWKKAGFELEKKANNPVAIKDFGTTIPAHPEYWISLEDVVKKLENDKNFKLVSIRSYEEFIGKTSGYSYIDVAGEPKGAVWGKAGSDPYHMEDYVNSDNTYITMDQMKKLWEGLDFNLNNELAFYCGTGWRATIPFLIMYENGYDNIKLYDGGWYQWQMNKDLAVQVGDPKNKDVVYTTVGKLESGKAKK